MIGRPAQERQSRVVSRSLRVPERRNVDVTLRQFIASAVRLVVIGLAVVVALGNLGLSITPFIAAIGDFTIEIGYRVWLPTLHYFDRMDRFNPAILKALQGGGIQVATRRSDVRAVPS